ncbi:MAG TPA: histidine kinase [Chitinophagaceae bacterium]|nr:histidine kinase [Chitinophagaceae bacterium]
MSVGSSIRDFLLFYAGISFLAMFYWLISFIYSKRSNYLILLVATASAVIYYLNAFGLILNYPKGDIIFLVVFELAWYFLASELNAFRRNLPSLVFNVYIATVAFTVILQLLSTIFFSWETAVRSAVFISMPSIIGVQYLFAYLWLAKRKGTARFAFFAYLPALVGHIFFLLSEIEVLQSDFKILGPIGGIIFMLLLFYGMVTYVITLRKKREKENLEKEELIRQQNIMLEQKVEERTRELEIERKRSEELLIHASQKQMAELELQSLRAQLNPHFMFNALNAIQELILKEDFENSHTYLARFAKLLRMVLESTEKPFAPLQKEIDFLELYISLAKLRLPNLQFSVTSDPCINKENTLIPNMILQPYIENALWHGLSHKSSDRRLEVNIRKQNGTVIYDVNDNGVGRKKSAELKSLYRKEHKSKGTELLAKRFKLLSDEFGSGIKTEVCDVMHNGEVGGTKVSIIVPDSLTQNFKNGLL